MTAAVLTLLAGIAVGVRLGGDQGRGGQGQDERLVEHFGGGGG